MENSQIIAEMQEYGMDEAAIFFKRSADLSTAEDVRYEVSGISAKADDEIRFVFRLADEDQVDGDFGQEDYLAQEIEQVLEDSLTDEERAEKARGL